VGITDVCLPLPDERVSRQIFESVWGLAEGLTLDQEELFRERVGMQPEEDRHRILKVRLL